MTTEKTHALEFLLSEAAGSRSRDSGVINSGQVALAAGTVLGRLLVGVGEKVSGTGDGVVGAVTIGSAAEPGVYTLTGKTEASNAGTFSVRTPSGAYLPDLTVAVAYVSSHINLTVADGANDWDIGDIITVTVTAGDYEALDVAEDDGAQSAAAILASPIDATDGDQLCAVFSRDCEVSGDRLTWPEGISDANKAIATAKLSARGIIIR